MDAKEPNRLSIADLIEGSVENAFEDTREIGYFSVDNHREVHIDRSTMKYYVPRSKKNQNFNLNEGYVNKTIEELSARCEGIRPLLKWITLAGLDKLKSESVDFVCRRGAIHLLLCTPFLTSPYDEWTLCARRFDGIIYLENYTREEEEKNAINVSDIERRMCAWGYKFEQFMTSDRPHGVPNMTSTTFDIEEFDIVAANKIGDHKLLIGAETDAVNTSTYAQRNKGDTSCYVELKTSKMIPNFHSTVVFRKCKSLKWWAQSVVVGVKEIICGFRDENGVIQSIETFHTENLPVLGQKFWSPETCFIFCNNFLKYVKEVFEPHDDHRTVYRFRYDGGKFIDIFKLHLPEYECEVIPEWYISEAEKYHKYSNYLDLHKASSAL